MADGAPRWRLLRFASLPSTQDFCRARAEAGEPSGLAVLADRQTRGRGTHGRSWQSPAGNLSLSVLLRPAESAATLGHWSLLAGVAAAETLAAHLRGAVSPVCKWPNDILLDGAKAAGMLVEAACAADAVKWLVIGFGVNLAFAPSLPERRTACVADYVSPPDPGDFAGDLLTRLDHWTQIRGHHGFALVRERWLCFAPAFGSRVALRQRERTCDGAFAGVDADGRLLLATEAGVESFAAGET
jgi:BirA family biotin operon repressor/biotin-[acetyl-CoA-carboxylase] ligase